MKTLNEKSHLIIGIGVVVLLMFLVFKLLYQPSADKKATLENEIAKTTMEDLSSLQKNLENETTKSQESKEELERLYTVKQFGYLDYTKMMDYVGEKSEETDVEIITLEKDEIRQNGKHYEVPYKLTMKGSYENLLMFVDSLYQIDRYMQVSNFLINQKASSEEIDTVQNDNSSKYAAWMNEFAQKLNKDLKNAVAQNNTTPPTEGTTTPPTEGQQPSTNDAANKPTNNSTNSGENYYKEFEKLKASETGILDLEMEVMFISMEPVYE